MSAQATAWAKRQKAGSPAGKAVLLCIAEYAGSLGTAWETQAVLAEESEQSVDSVQRRQKELVARGILRKIRLRWHHGKVTSDYLILAISPLFAASIETIREHLPAGAVPMRDSADQAANCGSAENDDSQEIESVTETEPPENQAADCGMDQAAGETKPCRTVAAPDESRLNQESPNPKSLSPEQAASEASPPREGEGEASDSPEMQKLWGKFQAQYPEGVLDLEKAQSAFFKLPLSEAADAVQGVELYADRCKRVRQQKPMKAHLFLAKRTWAGLLVSKPTTKRPANFTLVPFNSKRGRAVANLYLMTYIGVPVRCHDETGLDCYSVPIAPGDQMMAFADVPRQSQWEFFELHTPNCAAWRRFIEASTGKGLAVTTRQGTSRPGIFAPHPWPPRIDGTWLESPESPPSTGPPSVPQMTEDDIDAFTQWGN